MLEKDDEVEYIAEQLKELLKQLKYKEMYENERKKRTEVEDELREQYKKNADKFELLNRECLRNDELSKQSELLNKQIVEIKREVAKNLIESKEAHKKEMQEREHLMDEEILKQIENLKEEIEHLRSQLTAYGKDVEGHAKYCYEHNDIHEKNINKAIDTFVKQLKDIKETHRKEINSLRLKVEKLEKEKSQTFEDNKSQQKMTNGKSEHSTSKWKL